MNNFNCALSEKMEPNTKIVYRIDSQDRIVYVNDNWHKFAEENDASELTKQSILYRSLWDFISDHATQQFYREVIHRVRNDKPVFLISAVILRRTEG